LTTIVFFLNDKVVAQHGDTVSVESHSKKHSAHSHRNHIALFAGATSKFEKEGTHFTLGVDYLRKFPPSGRWAISIFGEAIFEEHTEWLFGMPIFYKIYENLWVRTGPAIEFLQEEEHGHGESKSKTKTEFLWRLGVGYDIMFGVFSISPSFDIDFGRSTTAAVWGLNFGYGF
jgi:hypothetical protein